MNVDSLARYVGTSINYSNITDNLAGKHILQHFEAIDTPDAFEHENGMVTAAEFEDVVQIMPIPTLERLLRLFLASVVCITIAFSYDEELRDFVLSSSGYQVVEDDSIIV